MVARKQILLHSIAILSLSFYFLSASPSNSISFRLLFCYTIFTKLVFFKLFTSLILGLNYIFFISIITKLTIHLITQQKSLKILNTKNITLKCKKNIILYFLFFISIVGTLNIQRDVMIHTMNRCCNFIKYYVKRDIKNATFCFPILAICLCQTILSRSHINYASDLLTFIKLSTERASRPCTMNIYK